MKKALIIGSGAGGATVAKELQGKFDITILEAGGDFIPFSINLLTLEKLKKTGLFFDERFIQPLFQNMQIRKANDGMVLVNGIGLGGTTTISAGNAIRMDADLKKIGINLDQEFNEIYQEIPITTDHKHLWRKPTKRLFEICEEMNLNPQPTPKMGDYGKCKDCGKCIFGCPNGVKWDSRRYLNNAIDSGAKLETSTKALKIDIRNGKAVGVFTKNGFHKRYFSADLIVLAAGGMNTPNILQQSGIRCENGLFIDPVLCVAAKYENTFQNKELSMPFVVQKKHYILSPYFDYLSFYFNNKWKYPAKDTLTLMIKLADSNQGTISGNKVNKALTEIDKRRLNHGINDCKEILTRLGIEDKSIFLGTLNAGHPGGMLPLTEYEGNTFHNRHLPDNLYVADATLIPKSLGNPPILTIIALAKRISKICTEKFA